MYRTAVLVAAVLSVFPVQADYEEGQRALEAGRTDIALREWQAAAAGGDRHAMTALGRLFVNGRGVLQDYVEAHKWFNLAASRGDTVALEQRDALEGKMTPAQVAAAQERAAAWRLGETSVAAVGTEDTASESTQGPPPRAIREAQGLLEALGYSPGPADGVWGRRSVRAYGAFLRDAGLLPAQTLSPQGLRALRAIARSRDGGADTGSGSTADAATPPPARRTPQAMRSEALHRAAKAGDLDGLKTALTAGTTVDTRDGTGRTALMHVVDRGYMLLVEPLLAAGANPDMQAPDGATALFMAAAHGHSQIIEQLMEAGADISIRGPKGTTAVDVARKRYGDEDSARKTGQSPAIIALVAGNAERMLDERRRLEEQDRQAEREREERLRLKEEARREDDSAFARAKGLGTVRAYAVYLESNPSGHHAAEARKLIEEEEKRKAGLEGPLVDAAKKAVSKALSLARTLEYEYLFADSFIDIALAQSSLGDSNGARRSLSRAQSAAERASSEFTGDVLYSTLSSAYLSIASWQAESGDIKGAKRSIARARSSLERLSDMDWKTSHIGALARALANVGDIAGAKRAISRALPYAATVSNKYAQRVASFTEIARAQADVGDVDGAERSIASAYANVGSSKYDQTGLVWIAAAQAEMRDIRGARRTAARIRDRNGKSVALLAIALAQAKAGDRQAAERSISMALSDIKKSDNRHGSGFRRFSKIALVRATLATRVPSGPIFPGLWG